VNINYQEIKISFPIVKVELYKVDALQIKTVNMQDIEVTECSSGVKESG
jgi:hypothetical protein